MPPGERGDQAFAVQGPPERVASQLEALASRVAQRAEIRSVVIESVWGDRPQLRVLGLPLPLASALDLVPIEARPPWVPPVGARSGSRFLLIGPGGTAPMDRARPPAIAPSSPITRSVEPMPLTPLDVGTGSWAGAQVHWSAAGGGLVWVAARVWIGTDSERACMDRFEGELLDRAARLLGPCAVRSTHFSRSRAREWSTAAWRNLRPSGRLLLDPHDAAAAALIGGGWPRTHPNGEPEHALVFGATGSGKTSYLVGRASQIARRGDGLVVFDVHGDLGARLVRALDPADRPRLIAIDTATERLPPGIAFLDGRTGSPEGERAHLLAALRRAGADETGPYWGFRLDRVFDTFARIVQEERGGLGDLYELLTDPARREVARLRTRLPVVARFLDELPAILRRNPEFLWPAAARLSRLFLSPRLSALVAPLGPPLPLEALLDAGRLIIWRLPIGELGSEGAQLAVTILAARTYLGRTVRREGATEERRGVTFLFDEAHTVAPPLLAEMLTEGRKFGVAVLAATQFPERLATEARGAGAASATRHVVFRTPRAYAAEIAPWLGLTTTEANLLLPTLPTGTGVSVLGGPGGRREMVRAVAETPDPEELVWRHSVARTNAEFGPTVASAPLTLEPTEERLLLAVLARETAGRSASLANLLADLRSETGPEEVVRASQTLLASGDLSGADAGFRLEGKGRAHLGFVPLTGAARESAEHRALLLEAFVLFARHGLRIEILQQGRYDARLPDAVLRWLAPRERALPPRGIAERLDGRRGRWGWGLSGGRDIYLEAEVSGADRPDRIRRGLEKGRAADAFVLFLVSDPAKAVKVRRVIGRARSGAATVWVLRRARRVRIDPAASNEPSSRPMA